MTHDEERVWLIRYLLDENPEYAGITIPDDNRNQWNLLRSLMNIREVRPASEAFLSVQNEFLQEEIRRKGITDIASLSPAADGIYLWQGDITALCCDAIVNAANSGMTGCYVPCHGCIDNAIHTYAGIQLRLECAEIMERQGHAEATGGAKITKGWNLPSSFVLHTVGPVVHTAEPTERDKTLLASCYRSCLALADECGLGSIAFCCISTGEFHFPNASAAEIALDTVAKYREETGSHISVVFDVFKDEDKRIYERLLGKYRKA